MKHVLDNRVLLLSGFWLVLLGGVAAVSFVIPRVDNTRLLILGVGAIGGAGVVLMLLNHLYLGLALMLIGGLVVPLEIGTGTQTSLNPAVLVAGLLTGLWVVDMVVVRRKIALISSRTILPLICLMVTTLISLVMGQMRWFPTSGAPIRAQLGGMAIFALSVLTFLLAAHHSKSPAWLAKLCGLFFILEALFLLVANFLGMVIHDFRLNLPQSFLNGATGSIVWVWLGALAFSQAAFNRKLALHWRAALVILLGMMLYVRYFLTGEWTSGWLPALVAMGAALVIGAPRVGVGIAVLGGLLAVANFAFVRGQVMVGDNEYSLFTRLEAWSVLFDLIKVNPLFGLGPANYRWYTPLVNLLGYFVSFNSHNNYVDLVAQTGLVGLGCYLWFMIEAGRLGWRLKNRAPDGFLKAHVIGCLGGLAGTLAAGMLGDWVIPFIYNVGMAGFRSSFLAWFFLGTLAAVEQWVSQGEVQG